MCAEGIVHSPLRCGLLDVGEFNNLAVYAHGAVLCDYWDVAFDSVKWEVYSNGPGSATGLLPGHHYGPVVAFNIADAISNIFNGLVFSASHNSSLGSCEEHMLMGLALLIDGVSSDVLGSGVLYMDSYGDVDLMLTCVSALQGDSLYVIAEMQYNGCLEWGEFALYMRDALLGMGCLSLEAC